MDICKRRSDTANLVIQYMLLNLSGMSYGYAMVVEGCFDSAIENYGYEKPDETKKEICEFVKDILNSINNDIDL